MKKHSMVPCCALALALLALTVGCNSGSGVELGNVEGTVTLGGEPLPDAMVIFTPLTGGRLAAGKTDARGHYELIFTRTEEGAELGEHVVEITTGDDITADDGTVQTIPEKVPAIYNLKTELRSTIERGSNEINFDLEAGGEIIDSNVG